MTKPILFFVKFLRRGRSRKSRTLSKRVFGTSYVAVEVRSSPIVSTLPKPLVASHSPMIGGGNDQNIHAVIPWSVVNGRAYPQREKIRYLGWRGTIPTSLICAQIVSRWGAGSHFVTRQSKTLRLHTKLRMRLTSPFGDCDWLQSSAI